MRYAKPGGSRSRTSTFVSDAFSVFVTEIVYGTRSPRVTFTIGVVFVTTSAPPRIGSTGTLLLSTLADVPGVSVKLKKYCVVPAPAASCAELVGQLPASRFGTLACGAESEACTRAGSGNDPTLSGPAHAGMRLDGPGV